MAFVQVLWFYILWHYTKAWQDIFRIIGNYLWFVDNFFSINLLLKTLLSPWRRLSIRGGKGTEDSFFGAFLINTIMRGVGFLIRSITILIGAVAVFMTIIFSFAFVIVWFFLPIIAFFLFFGGVGQIMKAIL
ncbi:MAG: hypothetical protein Q7K44_00230 [Candidatus Liptonbacteria bacterium]|nr:hypothetical protein [Candidatus Liptonbacteria bacterium]